MPTDEKPQTGGYEVGYCRPPKVHQFRKGQSGNPKGRPRGSRNLKTDLLEELGESMKVREDGRDRRISKQRALIKSMMARALKGNDRAAAKIIDLYLRFARLEEEAADAGLPFSDDERAVMQALQDRLLRRAGSAAGDGRDSGGGDASHGTDGSVS